MATAGPAGVCYDGQSLQASQIRLLTISNVGGVLRLHTTPHNLPGIIDYDAISYVWGTAAVSVRVPCNDGELLITPTAYEMLHHLRSHRSDPSRALWIDAICINQEDADEKAIQIPLMHQIYTKSTAVIVWMGPSTSQTETFMADFDRVSRIAKDKGLTDILDLDTEETVDGFFGNGRYLAFNERTAANIPGSPQKSDLAWEECRTIQRYRDRVQGSGHVIAVNIASLINILRSRQGKEPVDRIWAIAGLLNDAFQEKLKPAVDYSETGRKEYWRTYARFAKILMEESHSLGVFCIPASVESRDERIPSWCPPLSGRPACISMMSDWWNYPVDDNLGQPNREILHAEPDDEEQCLKRVTAIEKHPLKHVSVSDDEQTLHIQGFVVDMITEVVEDPLLLGALQYTYNSEWSTMSHSNPIHIANVNWHTRSLNLARRLAYGTSGDVTAIPPEYLMAYFADHRICKDAELAYRDAMAMITSCDPGKVTGLEEGRRNRAYECIGKVKGKPGYTFFDTQAGRFGTATLGCRPGDKICVLYGGHPLYALRWSNISELAGTEETPARFCSIAFIPHLMEPHQSDAARMAPDKVFNIR